MAVFTHLETDTGTNINISGATAVGAYTANGDKLVMCDVSIDAVAGNGDYVMYVTRQIGGSGSAYRILPQTTMAAASGLTAISAQSGWITVRDDDVLTVYVDGLAGDTATPDYTTRWFELAGVTAAAVADAVLDEATSGHTSAGSFGKAISDILADTGTDGVVVGSIAADAINAGAVKADAVTKIQNGLATPTNITAASGVELKSTQPTITWAQQKIVSNLSNNPALLISNNAANGVGLGINAVGNNGKGVSIQAGDIFEGAPGTGLVINGATDGAIIGGSGNVGIRFSGRVKDVDGFDPDGSTAGALSTDYFEEIMEAIVGDGWNGESLVSIQAGVNNAALEATLEEIKGAGWTNETLVALKNYVDELETRLTAVRAGYLDKLNVPGTLANSNDANTYKADVSGLATANEYATDFTQVVELLYSIMGGEGWTDETLVAIKAAIDLLATASALASIESSVTTIDGNVEGVLNDLTNGGRVDLLIDAIKAKTDLIPASPAQAGEYTAAIAAIPTTPLLAANYTAPDNAGIAAIKAKTENLPASPAAVGSAMTLTAAYDKAKDDVLTPLAVVDGVVDAIKVQTDKIPASPASAGEYTTNIGAIKAKTDNLPLSPASSGEYTSALTAIQNDLDNPNQYKADVSALATTAHVQEVEDKVDAIPVDTTVIAGQVWSYPSRSLTVSSVRPRTLVDGDQFTIYKDTSVRIPLTLSADVSGYTNLWFTIKREQDLESADTQSIVHMDYLTGLLYINKAAATAGHGSIKLDDPALGCISVVIRKDGAALLPVYAKESLRWEVKGIAGSVVDILLQGTCYIQPAVSRKIT